jgi:hypothetical protein
LGNRFDLDPLKPGVQSMNGVPFAIADEARTGGNSVIMLRSDEQFKNSAGRERHHSRLARKARNLFFLQTSPMPTARRARRRGSMRFRYEGHSKLIPGSNFAPFTAIVPVQQEVDVADWLGRPLVPAPGRYKHVEGNMNLYMQRWDNPRPDTTIESIVIRSRQAKEVPIVLGITLANEAQNLVAATSLKSRRSTSA